MQSTERCGLSDQENLLRLQKCLKGTAFEAVRGILVITYTVSLAIEALRMLVGRPEVIKIETLIDLALTVQNYRATMQAMGHEGYLRDPMLLNELLRNLPGDKKPEFFCQSLL